MLDSYIDKQSIIYRILKNSIIKNQLSHAYLFESNGNNGQAYEMALAFAKTLFCPKKYMNLDNCVNCTQCQKINKNEFSELNIIEPDGMWIKKEQLDMLQKKFETKSIESDKRIYIINHAEKLNVSAANSILKFLEEPESNIIAILIADNRYQLLNTIVSRCQIVSFKNENKLENKDLINSFKFLISNSELEQMSDDVIKEKIEKCIQFVEYFENHKLDTILYVDKLFNNIFNNRELILFAFDTMILYYKDVIKCLSGIEDILFLDYRDNLNKIVKLNNIDTLLYKINKLIDLKKKIYINANSNLLIDRLIIELNKGE